MKINNNIDKKLFWIALILSLFLSACGKQTHPPKSCENIRLSCDHPSMVKKHQQINKNLSNSIEKIQTCFAEKKKLGLSENEVAFLCCGIANDYCSDRNDCYGEQEINTIRSCFEGCSKINCDHQGVKEELSKLNPHLLTSIEKVKNCFKRAKADNPDEERANDRCCGYQDHFCSVEGDCYKKKEKNAIRSCFPGCNAY